MTVDLVAYSESGTPLVSSNVTITINPKPEKIAFSQTDGAFDDSGLPDAIAHDLPFAVQYGFMNFADIKVGTTTATTVALNLDNPYLQIVQSTTQVSTPLGANQGSTTVTIRSSSTASISTTLTLSVISPDGSEITSTSALVTNFPISTDTGF